MLLGTLGATLLENMLAGKGINRAGDRIIWADYRSKRSLKNKKKNWFCFNFYLIWKYKNIIRMNLDLMELILEIIYLAK